MPNGEALNENLEFIERIKRMPPDERSLEMARLTYSLVEKVDALDTKMDNLSMGGISKKASAASGGITAAVIIGIVEGLKTIFGRGQ